MKTNQAANNTQSILKAVLKDGTLLEAVLDDDIRTTKLIVAKDKKYQLVDSYTDPISGLVYLPMQDEDILKGHVKIPILSEIRELPNVSDTNELLSEISRYIHSYADVDKASEYLSALYCLNTWVYDRYEKVPYLRLYGLKETGKSRIKKILGSICYHTLDIGVGMSTAALFRSITKYQQGTVLIDEANFLDTSIFTTLVQIFNGGYEAGSTVTRCRQSDYEPKNYEVFCPKILANHTIYHEQSFENRMHTIFTYRTQRDDIPEDLSYTPYKEEANQLQRKLLAFRLHNFFSIDTMKKYDGIEKYPFRLREITLPLLKSAGFDTIPHYVIDIMDRYVKFDQEMVITSPEAMIIETISTLLTSGVYKPSVSDITSHVNKINSSDYTPRFIGEKLKLMQVAKSRKSNGFEVDLTKVNIERLRQTFRLPTGV